MKLRKNDRGNFELTEKLGFEFLADFCGLCGFSRGF
jgi:hypothetical protein